MKIEVLMSACKIENISEVLKNKNIKKAIIVNQMMPNYEETQFKNSLMFSYNEKGLSKSRNRLLEHMSGDIGIITDDDVTFLKDYEKIILESYKNNPEADVIIFNIKIGNNIKGGNKHFQYNKISILSVASCQITFRSQSIKDKNIRFNEEFGLGSTYLSGEENIFLNECLKKGLKIIHVPICLFFHPDEDTTGDLWNDLQIKTKGAISYEIFGSFNFIFKYYMAIFKYKDYKEKYSIYKFIKLFNEGIKEYKNKGN